MRAMWSSVVLVCALMPTLKPNGRRLNGRGSKWIRPERRRAIYTRDQWRCFWCNRYLRHAPASQRTLDHVVPRCEGGSHATHNLVTACKRCNDRRQAAPPGVIRLLKRLHARDAT